MYTILTALAAGLLVVAGCAAPPADLASQATPMVEQVATAIPSPTVNTLAPEPLATTTVEVVTPEPTAGDRDSRHHHTGAARQHGG